MFKGEDWWPTVAPGQALQQVTFPECDVSADPDSIELSETVNAFLFGRTPNYAPYSLTQQQYRLGRVRVRVRIRVRVKVRVMVSVRVRVRVRVRIRVRVRVMVRFFRP